MKSVRRFLYAFIFYSGLIYVFRLAFRARFKNPAQIFYTHRVIARDDPMYEFLKLIGFPTVEHYERKMAYLNRHYNVTGLHEMLNDLSCGRQKPDSVALTFDDGYKCIYTRVFPLLKKYRIPVTVFLSIDMVENHILPWHDRLMSSIGKTRKTEVLIPALSERAFRLRTLQEKRDALRAISRALKKMDNRTKEELTRQLMEQLQVTDAELHDPYLFLTWEEIREMEDSGLVSFGSHTMSHPILTRIPPTQARREIFESKRILDEKLRGPVTLFAYPNGREQDFSLDTIGILKEAGYESALTTMAGSNNPCYDHFRVNRHGLMDDPLCITALICAGFFELLQPVRCAARTGLLERLRAKNLPVWLPGYVAGRFLSNGSVKQETPVHIMFCLVDHFEPQHGDVPQEHAVNRIRTWKETYPISLGSLRDSDGVAPQHTWFYPPHHDQRYLDDLVELCRRGYGEIEMHLHHNRMHPFPDTADTLREKILRCIEDYSRRGGIFCLPDGTKTFAFIHGDWSLDNSLGAECCGVNNELTILRECGCYADFTFPSLGKAQPAMINRMYYAVDDPAKPKSYNRGEPVRRGGSPGGGLMMVTGILGPRFGSDSGRHGLLVETSNLDSTELPSQARADYWVRHAVRIPGKPDWLFIKLHTHGAVDDNFPALFGEPAMATHRYLVTRYNDRKKYFLHFVSARQMYNIVKAAEAGMTGNPHAYRDFVIPKYVYLK